MNQMRWYVCEMIVVVSLCCLSKIVVSRVFSWPSFLSSKAFCSLLEDHWSMFVIWHLDIFMESHFWLFMIVAKTLPSWRKLMVHLGDKRFSWVRTDCKCSCDVASDLVLQRIYANELMIYINNYLVFVRRA